MDYYCIKCGSKMINGECPVCSQSDTNYNKQIYNNDTYYVNSICPSCGTQLVNGICPICTNRQMVTGKSADDAQFKRLFVSPNEQLVTTLGNTYLQNYINNGSVYKGFSVVSDKRAYFYGTSYNIVYNNNGTAKAIKSRSSQMIDLRDITGTGFKNTVDIGYLIASIILFVVIIITSLMSVYMGNSYQMGDIYSSLIIVSLIVWVCLIFKYLASRLSLVFIQYAGGEIAIDIRWFSEQEIKDFQKQLRLAKDKVMEVSENAIAYRVSDFINELYTLQSQTVQMSRADELIKYAELLQKGMITQGEYDNIKRSLL